jgi:hypothetical protein
LRAFFGLGKRTKIAPRARRFCLRISVMYHSQRTDFTLSAADDLMDFLAGGLTKLLDLPGDAGAAGEREEEGQ